jgi:arsenate reductase (glutaredoxin)
MTQHPLIVERPILVVGDRAIVAKPPERVLELVTTAERA